MQNGGYGVPTSTSTHKMVRADDSRHARVSMKMSEDYNKET
jgi:hypothetical protein